jgi:hypothetical protein
MNRLLVCIPFLSIVVLAGCGNSNVQTVRLAPANGASSVVNAVASIAPSTFVTLPVPNGFTVTFGLNQGAPSNNSVTLNASTTTSNGVRMLVGEFTTSQTVSGASLGTSLLISQSQPSGMVASSLRALVQSTLGPSATQSSSRTAADDAPIAASIMLQNAGTGQQLASGFIPGGSDTIVPTSLNPAAATLIGGTTYRITIAPAMDQPINVGGN